MTNLTVAQALAQLKDSYANGQLASITYPSGLKVTCSRNSSGQITALSTQQQPGKNKPVAPFLSALS